MPWNFVLRFVNMRRAVLYFCAFSYANLNRPVSVFSKKWNLFKTNFHCLQRHLEISYFVQVCLSASMKDIQTHSDFKFCFLVLDYSILCSIEALGATTIHLSSNLWNINGLPLPYAYMNLGTLIRWYLKPEKYFFRYNTSKVYSVCVRCLVNWSLNKYGASLTATYWCAVIYLYKTAWKKIWKYGVHRLPTVDEALVSLLYILKIFWNEQ